VQGTPCTPESRTLFRYNVYYVAEINQMNSNLLFLMPLLLVIGLLFLILLPNKLISWAFPMLLVLTLLVGLIVMPIAQAYSEKPAILESAFKNSTCKCECEPNDDTCDPCEYQN